MGEAQSGKASLFSQLVAAPSEYAAQLGGATADDEVGAAGETGEDGWFVPVEPAEA